MPYPPGPNYWEGGWPAKNRTQNSSSDAALGAQDRSVSAERFTPQYNTEQVPLNGFYQTITLLSPGLGQPIWQSRPSL